jgi:hypothetical protein
MNWAYLYFMKDEAARVREVAPHHFKDLWQHRRQFVANTRWWPPFCGVPDVPPSRSTFSSATRISDPAAQKFSQIDPSVFRRQGGASSLGTRQETTHLTGTAGQGGTRS